MGAAMVGMRPVIEVMTFNFAILALDQIINNAAKMRLDVGRPVPDADGDPRAGRRRRPAGLPAQPVAGGSVRPHPGPQGGHAATPYDAKGLLKSAIRDNDPVIFIESEKLYNMRGEVPEEEYLVPIGKADIKHPGEDVTILTWSRMLSVAVLASGGNPRGRGRHQRAKWWIVRVAQPP
jgi:pyruvate dehydrogenase E1 component beta subunit